MTVAGIVFDKDGTLFDFDKTWGVITKALIETETSHAPHRQRELAQVLGFDIENVLFHPGSIVIASTSDVVADTILPFTQDNDRDALVARMTAATSVTPQVQVTDLQDLFANLKDRNIKLGIATNDAEKPALANLDQANVTGLFDFIAGFDSGFGAKPASGQLRAFCDQVGLGADQCVMVGDSLHDLHAGRDAGMRTIGVLTGPAPRAELSPVADVVLGSIAEIPAWLDQL